jgi:hypothetical protein
MVEILKTGSTINKSKQTICMAATFTARPIEDALNYWIKELNFPFPIKFALCNQLFQQLFNWLFIFPAHTTMSS